MAPAVTSERHDAAAVDPLRRQHRGRRDAAQRREEPAARRTRERDDPARSTRRSSARRRIPTSRSPRSKTTCPADTAPRTSRCCTSRCRRRRSRGRNDPVAFENIYPHLFLAHEVAHQWWGQAVGWKNYHEQWLSEGLAQYFAALYAGSDRGPDVVRVLIAPDARVGDRIRVAGPDLSRLPARPHPGRRARLPRDRLQQVRGGAAHAAAADRRRGVLRRPAALLRDWRFKKAGTDDFRAAMEAETPIKLERFFERWITAAALPRLDVTSRVDPSGRPAVIRIEQAATSSTCRYTVTVSTRTARTEDVTIPVTEVADRDTDRRSRARCGRSTRR